jgi:transcriptional regulator with XRE-family HTH domain
MKKIDEMFHARKTFPARLKALRTEKGFTQTELGRQSGVDRSVICWFEKGNRFPLVENLLLLSRSLGTSVDYLLGR